MLRTPSGRRKQRHNAQKINLIPILDAIFIFIFFLLMSASFFKVFEISSDVPMISNAPLPKGKPLALTVIIDKTVLSVSTGVPSKVRRTFKKRPDGQYDLMAFKQYLISLKKRYKRENTAILEPRFNINYETLVQIMDTIRIMGPIEEDIFYIDQHGVSRKVDTLFSKIVFANILS